MAVFFDMDGTLHHQDSFVAFLLFSAKSRPMVTFVLSPIIIIAMMVYVIFPKGKLGINIMLMALLFGFDKSTLDKHIANFAHYFNKQATYFDQIHEQLHAYHQNHQAIFIITGTPKPIAHAIYPTLFDLPNVHLIGSVLHTHKSCTTLTVRCIGNNKVTLLKQYLADNHLNDLLPFDYGFSDSHLDLPILALCQKTLWVNKQGEIHHQNT